MLRLGAIAGALALLAGCGVVGTLETPAPLWGDQSRPPIARETQDPRARSQTQEIIERGARPFDDDEAFLTPEGTLAPAPQSPAPTEGKTADPADKPDAKDPPKDPPAVVAP